MSSDDFAKPANRNEVEQAVRKLMGEVLLIDTEQAAGIDMEEPGVLTALGVTSIDAFELIVSIEELFGFEFDDQELSPDLVDPLSQLVGSVCRKIGVA